MKRLTRHAVQKYHDERGIKVWFNRNFEISDHETIMDCVASFFISKGRTVKQNTSKYTLFTFASGLFPEFCRFAIRHLKENNYVN